MKVVLISCAAKSHLMKTSAGLLHVLTRPDRPQPDFGMLGIARFIKPWTEWVIVLICHLTTTKIEASEAEIMGRVKELIGEDSIEIKLKNKSIWRINECYAEEYSKGNVFCLGDAVHRYPPHNRLGSNTCIQDAFNLAWKMAYVLKNRADPSLPFNLQRRASTHRQVYRWPRERHSTFASHALQDPWLTRSRQ